MIREKIEAHREKTILTYCITNDEFLKQMRPICKKELFKTPMAKEVYTWCAEYFDEYAKAPGTDITDLYLIHKATLDEDATDLIEPFLQNLSDSYTEEPQNLDYIVKQSIEYLRIRSLENLRDDLDSAIKIKDYSTGEAAITSFGRVEQNKCDAVDVITDDNAIISAFTDESETLFRLPGAIGELCGDFKRTDFIAFLAFAKLGKCVCGQTKIILSDGTIKTIKEIIAEKRGDVLSLNEATGKIVKTEVSDFWVNGRKPVYRVTTRTGREVVITSNHPLLSFDGWKTIDAGLSRGDRIAVPSFIPVEGINNIPEDHIILLAGLLADGSLTTSTPKYTKKEKVMFNMVADCAKRLGDAIRKGTDGISFAISKGSRGPQKSNTAKMLEKYGVPCSKSIHKVIPDIIFTLSNEQVAVFLKMLFSGDGSVHPGGVDYSSGSKEMIAQVQHLLLRFGIVSKFKEKIVNDTPYYELGIRDERNIRKYAEKIGFFGSKAQRLNKAIALLGKSNRAPRSYLETIPSEYAPILKDKLISAGITYKEAGTQAFYNRGGKHDGITRYLLEKCNRFLNDSDITRMLDSDIMWDTIMSIDYVGIEETYDLTIPLHHNFIANDIYVHNSSVLWHISQAAMEQGNKVLFITLEMPVNQMMRRIWCSLMGRPKRTKEITIPYFYKDNDTDDQWRIDWLKEQREGFKPELDSIHEWRDIYRKYFRSGDIKLASMPAKSVTVKEVIGYIDNLEYFENWIPDVVVIDYADLIGSRLKGEVRHQLDDIWSNLRRFALERNVCVVTASQSGRASANADATEETIAEDIRKIAHVTKMIAINGSKEERAAGLRRLAMLAERDDSMVFDHVYVTNCLDIGRFALDSRFKKDVYIEKRTRGEGD